ncbi:EthD family reductase [Mucilaginibacter sp. P25]|nr:EthD family reductase [Mucilaginibacter gossypii]
MLYHLNKPVMKLRLILSFILLATCFTAFSQEKKNEAIVEKGLVKISVMYPYAEGKTFNMEYYETKHMPMVAQLLGSNLVKYSIEKGIASGIPNQPLPFMAVGTFYVKSLSDYQAAIAPKRDAIRADFANYTNVSPVILVSEVVK